jgi:ribosomal protein L37AE/L43A
MKTMKKKIDPNHCDECEENCSTLTLEYNNTTYWLCDDCYNEHLKENETMERTK